VYEPQIYAAAAADATAYAYAYTAIQMMTRLTYFSKKNDCYFQEVKKYTMSDKLKVISLFTGIGGMDMGFDGEVIVHK